MGFVKLVSLSCAAVLLQAQPAIGPDEVRARSVPYTPPPPANTIRSEVNLVEVPVVVRDGKHRAVPGLQQSDFQVFDAGKKQEITSFSVQVLASTGGSVLPAGEKAIEPSTAAPVQGAEPARPRFIILCLDNMSTQFADLRMIKTAAQRFVRTGLRPGDRVAVVTTASSGEMTFTGEVTKLVETIEKVTPQSRYNDDNTGCPRITAYQAYLITNRLDNDTLEGVVQEDMACKNVTRTVALQEVPSVAHMIWEHALNNSTNILYRIGGLVETMKKLPGQRMLLLASSGFLSGNLEYQLQDLMTKALHSEVVINSLDAKGLYTVVPGRPIDAPAPRGRNPRTAIAELSIQSRQASAHDDGMAALALGTGGAFYHNSNDLEKGFKELGAIPDVVYILGFSPSDSNPDGRFHPLKVKLSGRYSVQSRMGYTAPTKEAVAAQVRQPTKMDLAAIAADTITDVPVMFVLAPGEPQGGNPMVTLVMHFDVQKLKFEARTDRRAVKMAFAFTMTDKGGAYIGGRQGEISLELKAETFEKIGKDGLNITMPLQAQAGNYVLRVVVQEPIEGKLTAANLPMELK